MNKILLLTLKNSQANGQADDPEKMFNKDMSKELSEQAVPGVDSTQVREGQSVSSSAT